MKSSTLKQALAAALAGATALVAAAPTARAQKTEGNGAGYAYEFRDDLLQGGGADGHVPHIRVRGKPRKDVLIRPRLHFVPEMLRSVEVL